MVKSADINWVKVAVEMAGGIDKVAHALGMTPAGIYKWIAAGNVRDVKLRKVVILSELSGVPLEKFK